MIKKSLVDVPMVLDVELYLRLKEKVRVYREMRKSNKTEGNEG